MSLLTLLYVYVFGGLTFVPLVLLTVFILLPKVKDTQKEDSNGVANEDEDVHISAGKYEEQQQTGISAYKAGWLTVTQEYLESTDDITSNTQSINENNSAYSALYKLVKSSSGTGKVVEPIDSPDVQNDNLKSSNFNLKKHRYYAILKHGNLFLYKNQSLKDVKHVIVLGNQFVTLWPRNVPDGQLFTKRTAICLIKKDWTRARRLSENFDKEKLDILDIVDPECNLSPPNDSFYIYCDHNIDKEDWYFTLLNASKVKNDTHKLSSNLHATTSHFETREIMDLIQTLYSSEGNLQTKWFNGIIGRLFLSLKRTEVLKSFLETRITKKLNKLKTPGFLEKFQLTGLDPGDSIPFFTYPNLKEINPNGTLVLTSYVHYHGGLSCNLRTKMNLNFGSRLSQVEIELKVTLKKLEGPLIFKIKPPPSDRIWYSFETEPIMNLKIEPVISSRQMSYNIITNIIEKKFKEAIKESLVVPHYDDLFFYNTESQIYRGGIWEQESSDDTDSLLEKESIKSFSGLDGTKLSDSESLMSVTSKPSIGEKIKISSTLSDLSAKMKRPKSSHTLGVSGSNFLLDGSVSNESKGTINKTLKKIGDWYNREDTTVNKPREKVEMYSNRRKPRQQSSDTTTVNHSPMQMFARDHSRTSSIDVNPIELNPIELLHKERSSTIESKGNDFMEKDSSYEASEFESSILNPTAEQGPDINGQDSDEVVEGNDEENNEGNEENNEKTNEDIDEEIESKIRLQPSLMNDEFSDQQIIQSLNIDDELKELVELDVKRSNSKLHRKAPPPL